MRLPGVRFQWSVRTALIAVALMALALASARLSWLSRAYRKMADSNEAESSNWQGAYEWNLGSTGDDSRKSMALYHSDLTRKYRYAASHPWISVSPDPPRPSRIP
jgi:hypothetical protein